MLLLALLQLRLFLLDNFARVRVKVAQKLLNVIDHFIGAIVLKILLLDLLLDII